VFYNLVLLQRWTNHKENYFLSNNSIASWCTHSMLKNSTLQNKRVAFNGHLKRVTDMSNNIESKKTIYFLVPYHFENNQQVIETWPRRGNEVIKRNKKMNKSTNCKRKRRNKQASIIEKAKIQNDERKSENKNEISSHAEFWEGGEGGWLRCTT